MRKSIAIFGGSLFQDIIYSDGKYVPTTKQASIKLSNTYRIDNYSFQGLSIQRAKKLLFQLPIKELYSDCILAVGEADLADVDSFTSSLNEIIDYLVENHVHPLLVSLPSYLMLDPKGVKLQEALDEIAVSKNVDYIYEGKTEKLVSYMVVEDRDIERAILNLC